MGGVGHFAATPQQMRRQAGDLDGDAANVRRSLNALRSRIAPYDGCWGSDDTGTGFAEGKDGQGGYVQGSTNILDGLEMVGEILANLATGVRATADNYERTELEAADAADRLGNDLA